MPVSYQAALLLAMKIEYHYHRFSLLLLGQLISSFFSAYESIILGTLFSVKNYFFDCCFFETTDGAPGGT